MITVNGKYTSANIMIDSVEESCMSQIVSFTNHPAFTNPIVIQTDCHAGRGSCIGFTMKMTDKLIPAVIGVDIGCGLLSYNVGPNLTMSLSDLDKRIRERIPFGCEVNEKSVLDMKDDFPWKAVNRVLQRFSQEYQEKFRIPFDASPMDMDWFIKRCKAIGGDLRRMINSLCSLGGGNHFFEVGLSDTSDYWLTVHSGSRNFGKRICDYWQDSAIKKVKNQDREVRKEALQSIKARYKGKELYDKIKEFKSSDINLDAFPCANDQRWLEGIDAVGYLRDMLFSQIYASINREYICRTIIGMLKLIPIDSIETVHNYIDFNDLIIRKGAITSYERERFLLPFNMRDGILICEGKSNPDWNFSAPHGAGRMMSRSQAKKNLSLDSFKDQMKDIYSTSVEYSTLDEAPDAYKDSKIIEAAIEPTAKIINRIKPVLNMKDCVGIEND
jgi:tRNA-splicing ligase RtcB